MTTKLNKNGTPRKPRAKETVPRNPKLRKVIEPYSPKRITVMDYETEFAPILQRLINGQEKNVSQLERELDICFG